MLKKLPNVGIDIIEVKRFKEVSRAKNTHKLSKFFSKREIEYCLLHKDSSVHFAGMFAAKEAISKALGTAQFPFIEIEIRHLKNGAPVAYFKNKKLPISLSISHTKDLATAIAIG